MSMTENVDRLVGELPKSWVRVPTSSGVSADSQDDSQFGVEFVYCMAHRRVHSVGWCLVFNSRKFPVRRTDMEVL